MSDREFRRIAVVERVIAGDLTSAEGAELLDLSSRQVKRLVKRYRVVGAPGLVHGNVGRVSNHARAEPERARVLELIREHYGGEPGKGPGQRLGPTLVSEQLWEDEGLRVPPSTVREWMIAADLWSRRRRYNPHRRRRERMAHFGELVQLDGSFHDWLECRGPGGCMMTLIDDATGIQLLRLGAQETFWAAIVVLRRWIQRYGVPRAVYTDWKTLYHAPSSETSGAETQFGRVCKLLGIQVIAASSPQAKGRVERVHGTNQDRLIKKLRLKSIATHEAANDYLEQSYIPAHNARFAKTARSDADYHLPLNRSIAAAQLWCKEYVRKLSNDGVLSFHARRLAVSVRRDMPAKASVLVRESEDGALRVIYRARDGREFQLPWREWREPPAQCPPSLPQSWSVKSRPRADHPWRLQHSGDARARLALRERALTPQGG